MRTCGECQKWVIDPETGRPLTYPDKDPKTGQVVELPMARADARVKPPCAVCPKADRGQPLPPEKDFGPWFYDLVRFAREGKHVRFPPLDPLTRAAVAAVLVAAERADKRKDREAVIEGVVIGLRQLRGK